MTAPTLGNRGLELSSRAVIVLRSTLVVIGLAFIGWAFSGDVRIVGGPGFGLAQATLLVDGVINLVASTLRVNILLSIIMAQASVFATLILAELVLRGTLSHRYYSALQFYSRYLYKPVLNARRTYRHAPINGEHEVIYRINTHGFRGPELAMETSNLIRIVVYGDSFIHAEFTELQETFAVQLEAILTLEALHNQHELILKRIARDARNRVRARLARGQGNDFDAEQAVLDALQKQLDEYREFVLEADRVVREIHSDPYSADISLLPDSPSANYKLAKMDALIERINATTISHNVPLLVLTIPHPMDVLDGRHESGVVNRVPFPDYQPARLTDSVQASEKTYRLHHVNLFPHFHEVADLAAL